MVPKSVLPSYYLIVWGLSGEYIREHLTRYDYTEHNNGKGQQYTALPPRIIPNIRRGWQLLVSDFRRYCYLHACTIRSKGSTCQHVLLIVKRLTAGTTEFEDCLTLSIHCLAESKQIANITGAVTLDVIPAAAFSHSISAKRLDHQTTFQLHIKQNVLLYIPYSSLAKYRLT